MLMMDTYMEVRMVYHKRFSILECIRKHIREYYAGKRKEKLRNCTVPWTIDISGVIKNIESNIPCSTDNSAFQSIEVSDYFVRASTYKFPQCKGIRFKKDWDFSKI